jgi:squalene-hopene/tetraprenyl-beta-curcumene cyclase
MEGNLIVLDIKPVRPAASGAGIHELFVNPGDKRPSFVNKHVPLFSWERVFIILNRLAKIIEASRLRPMRRSALLKIKKWILEHQEQTGDWAGIQPAMVNSILALLTLDYNASSEPVKKGIEALERFTIENEEELYLQACISPVWDTALTSHALLYSGFSIDHPALVKSCNWLYSRQILTEGDWSVKRPVLKPGGWAFEFHNNWYPDIDDTAVVLMLLNKYKEKDFLNPENLENGLQWILEMQGKDGGWGAFDVDNNMSAMNRIPFGDLEAMIDPSTSDITGRVLEVFGLTNYTLSDDKIRRAVSFIKREQEEDGCWWGRWGVNYINGTWSVLEGLRAIGEDMSQPYIKKAVRWLKIHQNLDRGWGETCESYKDPSLRGMGTSTASQTAWAIMALIAAGEGNSEEVMNGISFLLEKQKADGTWDEEEFTGTGFPKHFMIKYHNYRNCFPLMALGKFFYLPTMYE